MSKNTSFDNNLHIQRYEDIYDLWSNGRLELTTKKEGTVLLCEGLKVLGLIRDQNGTSWSLGVVITDLDNVPHLIRIKNSDLMSPQKAYWGELCDAGLYVNAGFPASERHIQTFLKSCRPEKRLRLQNQSGWNSTHETFLIPPDRVITADGHQIKELIYPELDAMVSEPFTPMGDLQEWISGVSLTAAHSSRLTIAICVALSGPLMPCSNVHENGGIHFYGKTSLGKSLTLRVGASVCMNPNKGLASWNVTSTGLEAMAAARHQGLLVMDELGAMSNQENVGQVIYLVSNGTGKIRGTKAAKLAEINRWQCCFLSSGEISLINIAKSFPNLSLPGGIGVRFHEIPLACGEDGSLFETLPEDIDSPSEAIARIGFCLEKNFGVLGPEWIQKLANIGFAQLQEQIEQSWQRHRDYFSIADLPVAERGGKRFHLFGFAGELATEARLTGWEAGHAMRVAQRCYDAWTESYFEESIQAKRVIQTLTKDLLDRSHLVPAQSALDSNSIGWDSGDSYCVLLQERVIAIYNLTPLLWEEVKAQFAKHNCFLRQGRHIARSLTRTIAGDGVLKHQNTKAYYVPYQQVENYLLKNGKSCADVRKPTPTS